MVMNDGVESMIQHLVHLQWSVEVDWENRKIEGKNKQKNVGTETHGDQASRGMVLVEIPVGSGYYAGAPTSYSGRTRRNSSKILH
jgi:hypothetical protein